MRFAMIVAATPDLVIGAGGRIPWNSPQDLAHFRRITEGKPVIVGRRTYESIGRALPGRELIVMTRAPTISTDASVHIAPTMATAVAAAERFGADEAIVAGGADVYAQFARDAETIYWSRIHSHVPDEGATLFPFDPFRSPAWRVAARWGWRGGEPAVDHVILVRR